MKILMISVLVLAALGARAGEYRGRVRSIDLTNKLVIVEPITHGTTRTPVNPARLSPMERNGMVTAPDRPVPAISGPAGFKLHYASITVATQDELLRPGKREGWLSEIKPGDSVTIIYDSEKERNARSILDTTVHPLKLPPK